jgi:hypothetical protein
MLNFDQQFEKDKRADRVFDQQQFVQEEATNVVGLVGETDRQTDRQTQTQTQTENKQMMRRTRGVSVLFREIQ